MNQTAFEKLQAIYRAADEKVSALRDELERRFGSWRNAPTSKGNRLESLRDRAARAADAIFAWLDDNSPRGWRSGAPAHWICTTLSYADAVTADQLSVIPPCAYGSFPADMERFARPVRKELAPAW